MTNNGAEVQNMIHAAQEQLALLDTVGCSPDHFQMDVELSHPQSLWRLFVKKVVAEYFFGGSPSSVYIQSTGSFRYDLYKGEVNLDDIISLSPFNDTIFLLSSAVKGSHIVQILGGQINSLQSSVPWLPHLPDYVCSVDSIDPDKTYALYTVHYDLGYFVDRISNITGQPVVPEYQNMTTTNLLLNFISQKWPRENSCEQAQDPLLVWLALSLCTIIALVTIVILGLRRKRVLIGYGMADIATEERAEMPDDEFTDDLI